MKRSGANFVSSIMKKMSKFFDGGNQNIKTSVLAVDKKNIGELVGKGIRL